MNSEMTLAIRQMIQFSHQTQFSYLVQVQSISVRVHVCICAMNVVPVFSDDEIEEITCDDLR